MSGQNLPRLLSARGRCYTAAMLRAYRVLDLTDSRAELAPLILAGLGADVVKIEPPGGCRSRWDPPLDPRLPGGLASLRFHAFNRGKRSVSVDLDTEAGRDALCALAVSADFLFENGEPGSMDARGLGFEALSAVNPRLVYVAITPFGQDGPYARHRATDLTLAAMGGMMALTGDADRRPVRISVPQTWHHAAAESAVAALVAHFRRLQTGAAQFVDVSVQAAVFWTGLNAMIAHSIQGADIERNGSLLQLGVLDAPLVYPCADGEVVLTFTHPSASRFLRWMLADGTVDEEWLTAEDWSTYDARVLTGAALVHSLDDVRARLRTFCAKYTKAALFARGLADGATVAPVNSIGDVLALEHLHVRGYWHPYQLPDGRTLCAPGPFVRASRTPIAFSAPAPVAGAHTGEVFETLEGRASARPRRRSSTTPQDAEPLPFAGVKIADFSWIAAGPTTAKYLADHGATVVHVETENPVDRLRNLGPFKDGKRGPNRSQFFASFNTSKLSLALNLKVAEGRE